MAKAWISIAKHASALLSSPAAYGDRLKQRESVATELGVSRQTLRNYMAAYDFGLAIEKADANAAAQLWAMPATAVEIYARWAARDRDAALLHLKSVGHSLSVAEIIKAEQEQRDRQSEPRQSLKETIATVLDGWQPPTRQVRREIAAVLERRQLPELVPSSLRWRVPERDFDRAMGVREVGQLHREDLDRNTLAQERLRNYLAVRGGGDILDLIATIQVGRSENADFYRGEAKPQLARAIAVGEIYPLVILLLPDTPALLEFESQLPALPYEAMAAGPLASLSGANRSQAGATEQPLRVTGSGAVIIVTSWMDVEAALFAETPRWFERHSYSPYS